jgi:hypothetical protein
MAVTISGDGSYTGLQASKFLTGQSWQNVTSSRGMNTWYTNSTGKPIIVHIDMDYGDLAIKINSMASNAVYVGGQHGINANDFAIVQDGEQYQCTAAGGRYELYWYEYR